MKRFFIVFAAGCAILGITFVLGSLFGAVPIIIGVIGFIAFTFFSLKYISGGLLPQDIPNGLPAVATVISCRQGNFKITMGGVQEYYSLIIDANIQAKTGETWQAKIRQTVPITQIGIFQPGVSFAVKYDPNNKGKVIIDQNTGQQQQDAAVDIPGMGTITHAQAVNAMQTGPQDIAIRLQASNALLNELKARGSQSAATILEKAVMAENYLPGADVYLVKYRVSDTGIEADEMIVIKKESVYKLDMGNTVYVRYDVNNPRRTALSGTDKPDNAVPV